MSSLPIACTLNATELAAVRDAYRTAASHYRATARIDTCDPNCVSGTFHSYPVTVALSKVKQCGDVPQFTRLAVTFTRTRPKGYSRVETQTFKCAEAPTG